MGHQSSKDEDLQIQEIKERVETEQKERQQLTQKPALTVLDKLGHIEEFNKFKNEIISINHQYNCGSYTECASIANLMWFVNCIDSKKYEWLKGGDRAALNVISIKWPEIQNIFDEKPDNQHRQFLRKTIRDAAEQLATVSLYRFPYY